MVTVVLFLHETKRRLPFDNLLPFGDLLLQLRRRLGDRRVVFIHSNGRQASITALELNPLFSGWNTNVMTRSTYLSRKEVSHALGAEIESKFCAC